LSHFLSSSTRSYHWDTYLPYKPMFRSFTKISLFVLEYVPSRITTDKNIYSLHWTKLKNSCSYFLLANVNSRSRSLYAIARPSVCLSVCRLSSVTLVHPTQAVEIFGNISTAFGTLAIRWHPQKISRRSSLENPSIGELNTRGVAISDLSTAISRKRCKTGGKLVLITNRKSYMCFRLVPKSVTLNDPERRNGRYFALFHRTRVRCHSKTISTKRLRYRPTHQTDC